MRVFLLACLVAVLVGAGAAYVLNDGYFPNASSVVFSTNGVRILANLSTCHPGRGVASRRRAALRTGTL